MFHLPCQYIDQKPSVRPVEMKNTSNPFSLILSHISLFSLFDFHETTSFQRLIKAITTRFVYSSTVPALHQNCLAIAATLRAVLPSVPNHFKATCSCNSGTTCGRP